MQVKEFQFLQAFQQLEHYNLRWSQVSTNPIYANLQQMESDTYFKM